MGSFLLAVQFLTVLPLKAKQARGTRMCGALIYFPLAGLLIGLCLWAALLLSSELGLSEATVNIALVVLLAAITGGIHLDGLSDTADAFLSGKTKEEMLAIMRDPHVGVMGVLAVIADLSLKVGLLFSVKVPLKPAGLLLACVLSRWAAVWAIYLFPYARLEGKARGFFEGMGPKVLLLSTCIALTCTCAIWRLEGLMALLIVAGCTYLAGRAFVSRFGGITGDTLGAIVEMNELVVLTAVSLA